jgi:hypothetical protein
MGVGADVEGQDAVERQLRANHVDRVMWRESPSAGRSERKSV